MFGQPGRHASAWRFCGALAVALMTATAGEAATIVRFATVLGDFDIQLFDATMPRTVANFLNYVNSGRYSDTVIHRNSDTSDPVLRDFVIQGGGYSFNDPNPPDPNAAMTFDNVVTDAPIADEPGGGVAGPSNVRGTIAMAKAGKNTATSQWFVNQGDNSFLDSPLRGDGGFSAFGWVLGDGMDVVDAIGDLPVPRTNTFGFTIASPFNDLPLRNFSGTKITDIRVANTVTVLSVTELDLSPGDVNRDGLVDGADLSLIASNLGLVSGAYLDDGDADLDGDVDGADMLLWQQNSGHAASTSLALGVPEPTAAALAILAGTACAAASRRRRQG